MTELALVAAATYTSGHFQEHGISRASKEFQKFLPSPTAKKEIPRSDLFHQVRTPMIDDPWKCRVWTLEPSQHVKLDSAIRRPVLIDVQEIRPDSVLFSFGIVEQHATQQHVLRFLMPGQNEALELSLLSDLVGGEACKLYKHLHTTPLNCYEVWRDHYLRSLVYSRSEVSSKASPVNFLLDSCCSSKPKAQPDGLVAFPGTRPEMKDLLSIVQEFYPSKSSADLRTESSNAWANIHGSSSKLLTVTVTPIESPKKIKLNPSPKNRNNRKSGKERDIYRRSSLHACESLLSLILEKRHGNAAISSLTKSDPELPQLLTQLSAGIAGTGLAVLFSVGCKVSGGRVPFCASKMLNTGVGLGLVWLSWAVNKLRNNVIYISKITNKVGAKDREMIRRVDQSVNEIFFRAATVMLFAMLKFA